MDLGNLREVLDVLVALIKKYPLWEKICVFPLIKIEPPSLQNKTAQ